MDINADTALHMKPGLPKGTWTSDNESVLTVNPSTGKQIGLHKGKAKITCALSNGDKQTITVTVTDDEGDMVKADELANEIAIHFEFNNAWDGKMNEKEQTAYDELVELMKERDDLRIALVGNTCDIGSREVNVRMGMLRATTIKKWMIRKGVKEENIEVRSMAYDNPVHDNKTAEHRRENRRVEVKILRD